MADNLVLYRSVLILAGQCDGAHSRDNTGFNRYDAALGHSLAAVSFESWTPGQTRAAWKMLRKYRGQLANAGIDYDAIPEPPKPPDRISIEKPRSQPASVNQKTVSIDTNQILIRFPYDPGLVEAVKEIPGRKWEPERKVWTVPITTGALAKLKEFIGRYGFSGDVDKVVDLAGRTEALATESIEASKAASAEIEVEGLGGTLRPFQKAGVKYAVEKLRVLFGDQMGLGKTVESLATLQALGAYPALVICPASLKYNWYNETKKWLPGKTIQILGTETVGRADANITIINYDQLKRYRDYLVQRDFKAVICDESHLLKSAKAQRTQFVEEIVNGCIYGRGSSGRLDRRQKEQLRKPVDVRLLLSGSPVLNRPEELVPQLQILDRLREHGGWYGFMRDYAGLTQTRWGVDTSGDSNLKVLNDKIRASCYIRRLKSEVLRELPPKQRTVVPTELTNRAEYDRAEKNLIQWLQETQGKEKADAAARAEQLVRIEALKRLAARGKMAAIKEWVEDFLDTNEKLVLFGWHQEVVLDLAQTFHCDAMYGGTPPDKRQAMVDRFQNDPATRLISLNMQTGGLGITLTAASNVLFCELGWNPAQHNQAGDRCHRYGQTDNVMEWWFIGRKTIDEDIEELIRKKGVVVDAATDGIERGEEVSVLNELVGRLRGEEYRNVPRKSSREDPLEIF